ncbi:DUF3302 domain-containing protein [Bradyrhizobium sp. Ai1a-2]|uniref:DUF3302 domain-containing protein n=1 Tax=Bradyrhizobium sp. Ai1a-2 TaxID=196490 RepID=UPI0004023B36|nr:DUF3302 domain-containing protein [Bradyrhizobium sp. Ai1a-2]
MDSTFGILDAFAFVVFAVLITVAVIAIVSLGQLPGRLARKWEHPQASAITSWIGMATGGLLWPLALIWAFVNPSGSQASRIENDQHGWGASESEAPTNRHPPMRKL